MHPKFDGCPLHLFGQGASCVRRLLSIEDVEIVIGSVSTRVTFSANWRPENNEVFRNAGMNNIHPTHGAAGIVEDLQMEDDKQEVLDAA